MQVIRARVWASAPDAPEALAGAHSVTGLDPRGFIKVCVIRGPSPGLAHVYVIARVLAASFARDCLGSLSGSSDRHTRRNRAIPHGYDGSAASGDDVIRVVRDAVSIAVPVV